MFGIMLFNIMDVKYSSSHTCDVPDAQPISDEMWENAKVIFPEQDTVVKG